MTGGSLLPRSLSDSILDKKTGTDGTFTSSDEHDLFVPYLSRLLSENLQGGGVISVPMRLHYDPHILIERHQEAQQAFHRKLAKFTPQHLGNIRLPDSKQLSRLHLFEAASF
jgi:hypothetical protein